MSRNAGNAEKNGAFVTELREAGCRVAAVSCDISIAGHLAQALRACEDQGLPPVRGVIQSAMVLQDSVLEHMTSTTGRHASGQRSAVRATCMCSSPVAYAPGHS